MKKVIIGIIVLTNLFLIGCSALPKNNTKETLQGGSQMYKFFFGDVKELEIKTVSVVGDFNNWEKDKNMMHKNDEGIWETEISLQPGTYLYQFMVNGQLPLNDTQASLMDVTNKGELKSVIKISEEGRRLGIDKKYNVNFSDYGLCTEENKFDRSKKQFSIAKDEMLYANFEFKEVTGVHNLTLLWTSPDGSWANIEEYPFYTPEGKEDKPIIISSKLPLDRSTMTGDWKLQVFINGHFIFEDSFTVLDTSTLTNAQEFLPIGSVVLLQNSNKKLMIFGRAQRAITDGKVWDYMGCFFPEGNISLDKNFMFNHQQIQTVCFRGLENEEEQKHKEILKQHLQSTNS